jgi:hypothetical protein
VLFAPRVQPNFVEHAREIHHPFCHLLRTFWAGGHEIL